MKSPRFFAASVGLNVVLLGASGWLFVERSPRPPTDIFLSLSPDQGALVTQRDAAPTATARPGGASIPVLRWADIESDDYPTYIANLRAAGMPEPTLRAVVTAEIVAQDDATFREIASQATATGPARWQELENLRGQQAARIDHLLGISPAGHTDPARAAQSGAPSTHQSPSGLPNQQPASAEAAPATTPLALLPAALVPLDPAISLNEQQATEWNKLQQDFVADVGNPNDNSGESTYLDRWIAAQRANDAMFKAKYGNAAFILQNFAASRRPTE